MLVGIIGAMEEEIVILREKLVGAVEFELGGFEFAEGELAGVDVVLLKSGIGKVNAAIATTLMIQIYQPDYIINTGSAGGFNQELSVGDIVVADELRYHDVDATVFGYDFGQVPGMPASYLPDSRLVDLALKSGEQLDAHVVKGLITSSDSFMDDLERVNVVRRQFPGVKAAEMESTAIAQTAWQFGVPFVIIRSLSDIAGSDSLTSYEQFLVQASINSAALVELIIKEMGDFG